jgi:aerobic carbon-monoxide dehydrogenase small subunit
MKIKFLLNNKLVSIDTDPSKRLLDIIREDFNLKGTKEGCGEGECGACMVIMNGKAVNSCLIAAGMLQDAEVLTIEGLHGSKHFKILEKAYAEAGAVQCGFCTPGFMITSYALLKENPFVTREEIKDALSGNLCRCTGYNMIIDAVKKASEIGEKIWKKH